MSKLKIYILNCWTNSCVGGIYFMSLERRIQMNSSKMAKSDHN